MSCLCAAQVTRIKSYLIHPPLRASTTLVPVAYDFGSQLSTLPDPGIILKITFISLQPSYYQLLYPPAHLVPVNVKGFQMFTKINHIGLAVSSINEALPFYRDSLGMTFSGTEEVASQLVKVAFLAIGESKIELLEPTSPDSPVAKFLEKNGPGVHHVAYGVDDIEAAIASLIAAGTRMIDTVPRTGAHGARIAFIHPKSSGGVLTELCQSMK